MADQQPKLTGNVLDDNGNVIGTLTGRKLDDSGNPVGPDATGTEQQSGTLPSMPFVANAVKKFAGAMNPLPLLQAISQPSVGIPIPGLPPGVQNVATGIAQNTVDQGGRAVDAFEQGNYSEAIDRGIAALPVVGPLIEDLAADVDKGDYGSAVGNVASLAVPMPGPRMAGPVRPPGGMGAKSAEVAERMSTRRMTQAITPRGGPNQLRLGREAAEVSPQLAREEGMSALTRSGMASKTEAKLEGAQETLDTAANERFKGAAFDTKPTLDGLKAKRQELVAEAIQASRMEPERYFGGKVKEGVPMGEDQIPAPYKARVATLDQVIKEIEGLGPMARYESVRRIREAWDQVAKVKYSPATAPDFLLKNAEASGAADATGVMRDKLADMDPKTAEANAPYSFWRKTNDVIKAAEEWDQSRPPSNRGRIAAGAGAITGAIVGQGNITGLIVGTIVGAGAEHAISSGVTSRIAVSRQLAKVSDALKSNDAARLGIELRRYAQITGQAGKLNALLQGSQPREGGRRTEMTPSQE